MAKATAAPNISTRGEWICRDGNTWRVKVPTANGQQVFEDEKHGGSHKSLMAARAFHEKMYNQLKRDRAHFAKTGNKPERETMYYTNKSGHRGVALYVIPRLEGPPNIVYVAHWKEHGVSKSKGFSTAAHGTKQKALELAIAYRKKMTKRYR